MSVVSVRPSQEIWGANGWFTRVMHGALEDGPLPCNGQGRVFGASADGSPIAAALAARICLQGPCPILAQCRVAGEMSQYEGVWGGRLGGTEQVRSPQPAAVRAWVAKVAKAHAGNPKMLMEAMLEGIPTFGELLKAEHSQHEILPAFTSEGCLSLAVPDAKAAVEIRRRITRDAIMLGIDSFGMARIELICRNTASCISPWHMLWSSDREVVGNQVTLEGSRSIAFCLFLLQNEGWSLDNIQKMTGYSSPTIRSLGEVSELIGNAPFVHGNAWDILQWGRHTAGRVALHGHHETSLIRLARAGEELSCTTVADLVAVGRELY